MPALLTPKENYQLAWTPAAGLSGRRAVCEDTTIPTLSSHAADNPGGTMVDPCGGRVGRRLRSTYYGQNFTVIRNKQEMRRQVKQLDALTLARICW